MNANILHTQANVRRDAYFTRKKRAHTLFTCFRGDSPYQKAVGLGSSHIRVKTHGLVPATLLEAARWDTAPSPPVHCYQCVLDYTAAFSVLELLEKAVPPATPSPETLYKAPCGRACVRPRTLQTGVGLSASPTAVAGTTAANHAIHESTRAARCTASPNQEHRCKHSPTQSRKISRHAPH